MIKSRLYTRAYSAAGNAAITAIPSSERRWAIHTLRIQLVADANAANRFIRVRLMDAANQYGQEIESAVITAGLTRVVAIGPIEAGAGSTLDTEWVSLKKPIGLAHTMSVIIDVTNGLVGDALTARLEIEDFASGN